MLWWCIELLVVASAPHPLPGILFLQALGLVWSACVYGWGALSLLIAALGPGKQLVQRLGWNEDGTVQLAQCALLWCMRSGIRCFRVGQAFQKVTRPRGPSMPSIR